jgi:hypothetical protein
MGNSEDRARSGLGDRILRNDLFKKLVYDAGLEEESFEADVSDAESEVTSATPGAVVAQVTTPEGESITPHALKADVIAELDGDDDELTSYKHAFAAMNMIEQDDKRRDAALVMLQSQGKSRDGVIRSIDSDRARLDSVASDILQRRLASMSEQLEVSQHTVASCDSEIRSRTDQIALLEQQIQALKGENAQFEARRDESAALAAKIEQSMKLVEGQMARVRDDVASELTRLRVFVSQSRS